ncbi:DUF2255 family protein [Pseudonocardia lacus]|uniref:DUF2255 family protein n=1 Tax=Pseudonocardia lacus TaxID=2835865 RepID=UPI001BDDB114|nr:DUF2255 family protein [Pseudonocardia lacus]
MSGWSAEDLRLIDAARELEIAVERPDGRPGRWLPIWVVRADDQVYVRTWYRRDTGWYGRALRSRRARIRVPGREADVTVEDVGAASTRLGAAVDDAYRAKYGSGADSMVTDTAVATTLRLTPE